MAMNVTPILTSVVALLTVLALCVMILGFVLQESVVPKKIVDRVKENKRLRENSKLMKKWANPSYEMSFAVHMFNVTNPTEVENGEKPMLKDCGPYVYRLTRKKFNVKFSSDQSNVTYQQLQTYLFDQEQSCKTCTEKDKITIPNVVLLVGSERYRIHAAEIMLKHRQTFWENILERVDASKLFVTHRVSDLLFHGYSDPLLEPLPADKQKTVDDVIKKQPETAVLFPRNVPKKIGIFYKKNNSDDGTYTIGTGVGDEDFKNYGKVFQWNGSTTLPTNWWDSEVARKITGSGLGPIQACVQENVLILRKPRFASHDDGSLWPPYLTVKNQVTVFSSSACRSMHLIPDQKPKRKVLGIDVLRFILSPDNFNPDLEKNRGYCNVKDADFYPEHKNVTDCLPKGFLDVSRCKDDKPIAMSMPHFLFAPEELIDSVGGLEPDSEKHNMFIDIEPMTGIPVGGSKQIQLNVKMHNYSEFKRVRNIKNQLMPLLWVNESAAIDKNSHQMLLDLFKYIREIYKLCKVLIIIGAVFSGIGILALMFLTYQQFCAPKPKAKDEPKMKQKKVINKNEKEKGGKKKEEKSEKSNKDEEGNKENEEGEKEEAKDEEVKKEEQEQEKVEENQNQNEDKTAKEITANAEEADI